MASKRDQQQNIQAWFNTVDDPENPDYPIVAYFNLLRDQGWSPKKIIGTAILALQDALPGPSSVDQKFDAILTAINSLAETFQSSGLHLDPEAQASMESLQAESSQTFDAVGRSMAKRYTPIVLHDDEGDQ